MTISTTTARYSYSGNGVTTAFSFPNLFFADADLSVFVVDNTTNVVTNPVLNTDYTVSGAGSMSGGTVTFLAAPATGSTVVIARFTAATQGLDLDNVTALPMTSLEAALDRAMMAIKETAERLSRAIRSPISAIYNFDWTMPTPVASKFLGVNAAGTGLALKSMVAGPGMTVVADETNGTMTFSAIGLTGGGSGNVVGPVSSVDRSVPVYSGTTGRLLLDPNVMTITAGGNVGIGSAVTVTAGGSVGVGTASPTDGLLHLNGGASTNIKFTNAATGTTVSDGLFVGLSSSGDIDGYFYNREATGVLKFGTANTERMRIDASGNVGIGTFSPASKLDVQTAGGSASIFTRSEGTTQLGAHRASTDVTGPVVLLKKSRGTLAAEGPVVTSDTIGEIRYQVFGGTNSRNIASIFGLVETFISDADIASAITFATSATGGVTAVERLRIQGNGDVVVTSSGGLGYGTGSGGAVTQATSRTTAVTLNKMTGVITLFTAAGSATPAQFTVNNNLIGANDTVLLTVVSGSNVYVAEPYNISAGVGFGVNFWASTGTASDTPKINFTIIKGSNA